MGLNIKNQRVHDLAREAARRTGANQTSAIETALVRYLAELDAAEPRRVDAASARLEDILHDFDQRLTREQRESLTTDDLYDELGLPR
jgi:antitoxin VapB